MGQEFFPSPRGCAGASGRSFQRPARAPGKWAPPPLPAWAYAAIGASLLVLTGLILLAFGRNLACDCPARLWDGGSSPEASSQHFADWYSLLHFVSGMALFGLMRATSRHWPFGWLLIVAVAAAGIWEVVENTPFVIERFGHDPNGRAYLGDSVVNAVGDMLFMLAGFLFASRLRLWTALALAVTIETAVMVLIADGLVLGAARVVLGAPGLL